MPWCTSQQRRRRAQSYGTSPPATRLDAGEAELQRTGANRSFGLLLVAVFALSALFAFIRHKSGYITLGMLAVAFAAISLWMPRVLAPFRRGWLKLGHVIGRIVNPAVLGITYAIAIIPTGLLMQVFGRNSLALKRNHSTPSYWIKREIPGPDRESLKEQF